MFRDGRPIVEEPVLGVVAAGGCDLSLSFGLPRDVAGAVGHLAGDNTNQCQSYERPLGC
jgi:hypothetical protein